MMDNERLAMEIHGLERERDRLQAELDHCREDEEFGRKARRDAFLQSRHEADTWEEAFQKGIVLARQEARDEAADIARWGEAEAGKPYFRPLVEAWELARQIYTEEMAPVRKAALERIAQRVLAELPEDGGREELVEALRADNHSYLVDW